MIGGDRDKAFCFVTSSWDMCEQRVESPHMNHTYDKGRKPG